MHFWRSAEFVLHPAGYVGCTEVPAHFDQVMAALSHAFAAFNRGSGMEAEFDGPSASVGDVFAIEGRTETAERTLDVYRIRGTGFQRVDFPEIGQALRDREMTAPESRVNVDMAPADLQTGQDRDVRSQRALDAHDRMMAARAADAARDTLHNSTPFVEPGSYTVFEARDRAAHTPSIASEIERQSIMADKSKANFTDKERYLLDVQRRRDMAEIYPDSEEAQWLRERVRLAESNPEGPESRQVAEEVRLAKFYADDPEGARPEGQSTDKEAPKQVTPAQKERVDQALGKVELSKQIGGASDVGGKPAPNEPAPIDKSRNVGQDLQRQGVTMDKDK